MCMRFYFLLFSHAQVKVCSSCFQVQSLSFSRLESNRCESNVRRKTFLLDCSFLHNKRKLEYFTFNVGGVNYFLSLTNVAPCSGFFTLTLVEVSAIYLNRNTVTCIFKRPINLWTRNQSRRRQRRLHYLGLDVQLMPIVVIVI